MFTLDNEGQNYLDWQKDPLEHRQVVAEVQDIAQETEWRGPETPVSRVNAFGKFKAALTELKSCQAHEKPQI